MAELTFDLVKSQLTKKKQNLITQETIDEINHLAEDPDYGQEFLSVYLDCTNILKSHPNISHDQYLRAIKFYSLVEADNTLVDAYIKVFPERWEARKEASGDNTKECIRSEASRFNKSVAVNEIRRITAIPVHLIHRNILHEAILESANLMRTAKSEMVRQKAAATLITELKPPEDHTLNVNVNDGSTSVIEELRKATEALAAEQFQSVNAGVPLTQIADAKIIEGEAVEVEDD